MSEQELQEVIQADLEQQEQQPAPAPEVETESPPVETSEEPKQEADGPISEEEFEAAETKADEPEEEKPKPRNRFQERIDKLTADKYAAEREARALRDRLEQIQSREQEQIDPEDYESIERARLKDVLNEERYYDTASQAERMQQQAAQVRAELFNAKVDAARDRIPDLGEKLRTFAQLPCTPESAEIIAESDKAAEIAHYLGGHPEMAEKIASMSPAQQGRAIAQIESRVSLPTKRATQAPPPAAKLKPASAPQQKTPEEMSAAEYVKWRQAQWKSSET